MGCEGRAGVGQASLSLALALPSPALLLSVSIKQPKHLLLCKQRPMGFMELRVTMCPVPSTSRPRAAALRVPGSGCTHPHELARDVGPSRPSVHVPVPSTLALVLSYPCQHPGAADPACPCPLPSLAGAISWGVAGTRLGVGGGSASAGSCSWGGTQAVPPAPSKHRPQPSLVPSRGTVRDVFAPCVSCASSFKIIRFFAFSSLSPFPAEAHGTFHRLSREIAHQGVWRGQDQTSSDIYIK